MVAKGDGRKAKGLRGRGRGAAANETGRSGHPVSDMLIRALEPRILLDAALDATFDHMASAGTADDATLASWDEAQAQSEAVDAVLFAALSAPMPDPVSEPTEIYVLDAGVADPQAIVAALPGGADIIRLDAGSDGVAQLAAALDGRRDISAIHIISHGEQGQLFLGNGVLDATSMQDRHLGALTMIGQALTADGDILIYGCDFAGGDEGLEAAMILGGITGADIAASDDPTGASTLGGDWDLEQTVGEVETGILAVGEWDGLLTKTVINPTGGTAADGSDGLRIHVISNGQYQIDYRGVTQLYAPGFNDDNTLIFNGIYMAVGNTVVGPATDRNNTNPYSGPANGPGVASTDATFREAGQTITGSGTQDDPFRVTTTLYYDANNNGSYNPLSDYQLVVVTSYSAPDGYMTLDMTVTPPPGNTQVIKLYHTIDTFLSGGDNGPAFSLPQNLAQTNNTTGDPTLVAVRKDPGGPNDSFVGIAEAQGSREFDHWFSGQYDSASIYGNGINNGGDIDNGWDTNPATDNGVAVQFTLGTITTAENWSYHIAFSSEASIDLDADDSSGATGSAYNTEYPAGSGLTIPVVDTDAHIANVTGDILQVRATLANAQAGDSLTVNAGALPVGIQIVSQTATQIVLCVTGSAVAESTFDLALQTLGFTTSSTSMAARTVNFAVTNELGIEGFASAATIGINLPPVANNDSFIVQPGVSASIAVLGNDTDAEGDVLFISQVDGSALATIGSSVTLSSGTVVTRNADGTLGVVMGPGGNDTETFTYQVSDSQGGTSTATVTLSRDTDGDGVANATDVDDDNDGILDTVEGLNIIATVGEQSLTPTISLAPSDFVSKSGTATGGSFASGPSSVGTISFTGVRGASGGGPFMTFTAFGGINGNLGTIDYRYANIDQTNTVSGAVNSTSFEIRDIDGDHFVFNLTVYDLAGNPITNTSMFNVRVNQSAAATTLTGPISVDSDTFQFDLLSTSFASTSLWIEGVNGTMISGFNIAITTSTGSGDAMSIATRRTVVQYGGSDQDGDSLPNYLDIDSDNDGITDNVEGQSTTVYTAPSGIGAAIMDINHDGLDDTYDVRGAALAAGSAAATPTVGQGIIPVDTDRDSRPDFLDANSDGVGANDIAERGDGAPPTITSTTDTDMDGLLDIFEGGNVNDGFDVNDENLTGTTFNLADTDNDTAADGTGAVPLRSDLDFRDNATPIIDLNSAATVADTSHDYAATYTEGDAAIPMLSSAAAGLTAQGEADLTGVVIVMASPAPNGANEIVSIGGQTFPLNADKGATVSGVSISYIASTRSFLFHNNGNLLTDTTVQSILRTMTYANTAEAPTAGDRVFTFTATDTAGNVSAPAVSTITVVPVNDAPVAVNDGPVAVNAGSVVNVAPVGNDTDADGDTLSVSAVFDPANPTVAIPLTVGTPYTFANGTQVTLNGDGTLDVRPDYSLGGSAPFDYEVSDGQGGTDRATITLDVTPVPPVVSLDPSDTSGSGGDNFSTNYVEDNAAALFAALDVAVTGAPLAGITIAVTGVLNGDDEVLVLGGAEIPLGTSTAGQLVIGLSNGNVTISHDQPNGLITIAPATGTISALDLQVLLANATFRVDGDAPHLGTRSFTLVVSDIHGLDSAPVTTSVSVTPVNDAPYASIIGSVSTEVVVVDMGIPGAADILAQLPAGATVIQIAPGTAGVQELANLLQGYSGLTAIHLITHGESGQLHLGSDLLTTNSIGSTYAADLAIIGSALGVNGDILVYGCNFGQDVAAVAALASATGADIAASDDNTGAQALGGDWTLEVTNGTVEADGIRAEGYDGLLAPATIAASGAPTLRTSTNAPVGGFGGVGIGGTGLWVNAGTVGGQAIDIRATVVSATGASAGLIRFATSGNDLRVTMPAGVEAVIRWEMFESGTNQTVAIVADPTFTISDLDGLAGTPIESVTAARAGLSSFTVDSPTNIALSSTATAITASGTQTEAGAPVSNVTFGWTGVSSWQLTYTAAAGSGSRDFDHDGNGQLLTNYMAPDVTALNVAPAAITASLTGLQGQPLPITGMSFSDPDGATGDVTVTLSIASGTLDIDTSVVGGLTAGQVTGDDTGTITITAPLSAINATLAASNGLVFNPPATLIGPVTLSTTINDLGNGDGGVTPLSATSTATISLIADTDGDGVDDAIDIDDDNDGILDTVEGANAVPAGTRVLPGQPANLETFVVTSGYSASSSTGTGTLPNGVTYTYTHVGAARPNSNFGPSAPIYWLDSGTLTLTFSSPVNDAGLTFWGFDLLPGLSSFRS